MSASSKRAQAAKLLDTKPRTFFSKQTTPFLYFEAYLKRGVIHEYQIKSFGSVPINRETWLYCVHKHSMKFHVLVTHVHGQMQTMVLGLS